MSTAGQDRDGRDGAGEDGIARDHGSTRYAHTSDCDPNYQTLT